MAVYFNKEMKKKVLESGLVDGQGPFHFNLYTNDPAEFVSSGEGTHDDFVHPTYPGYAAVDTSWVGPYDDESGEPICIIEEQVFAGPSITSPVTVYGWVASQSSNQALCVFEAFDQPLVLTADNFIGVAPSVKLESLTGATEVRS